MRVRITNLRVPLWVVFSLVAPVLAFGLSRVVLGESWAFSARDAYIAVLMVWILTAIEWARDVFDDVRDARQMPADE